MDKLKVPENVVVKSSSSGWWNERLDHEWITDTFPLGQHKRYLFRDRYGVHKKKSSKLLLQQRNIQQILVPPGMTGQHQPLDVGVNKPFKAYYKEEYHRWRQEQNENEKTKSGYMKNPNRQESIDFISAAWDKVSAKCVKNSFIEAGIIYGEKENSEN